MENFETRAHEDLKLGNIGLLPKEWKYDGESEDWESSEGKFSTPMDHNRYVVARRMIRCRQALLLQFPPSCFSLSTFYQYYDRLSIDHSMISPPSILLPRRLHKFLLDPYYSW